jgi:hypothetical protein
MPQVYDLNNPNNGAILPMAFTYNADGTINYITATSPRATYRMTFTYSGGKVVSVSVWVRQ